MGKIDNNKQMKRESLLDSAFSLFIDNGFNKTSISDIVNNAGVAKGTFYLYFKDKYQIRDILIQKEVRAYDYSQLIDVKKEINAIGRNINQLVKIVNTIDDFPLDEFKMLQDEVETLKKLYADKVSNEIRATRKK